MTSHPPGFRICQINFDHTLMTWFWPLALNFYATILAVLLQSYKIALYVYINYPTFSSCVVTVVTMYFAYRIVKYIVKFILTSLVTFIRVIMITSLIVTGVWCYARGPELFVKDIRLIAKYGHQIAQSYTSDRDELLGDLKQGLNQEPRSIDVNNMIKGIRLEDFKQLVELFGFNILQFYGVISRNIYNLATSDTVKSHYQGLYREYQDMYREL